MFSVSPLIGPVLGPVVGGIISDFLGWYWCFHILAMIAFVILVLSFFLLPETLDSNAPKRPINPLL